LRDEEVPTFKMANRQSPNIEDKGVVYRSPRDLPDDVSLSFPMPFVKTTVALAKSKWLVFSQIITLGNKKHEPTRDGVLVGLRDTLRAMVKQHGPLEIGAVAMNSFQAKVFAWAYPNEET